MLLHLTRVDDVMCFKHLSFLFLVHQEIVGSKCGWKVNIGNIEKSRQYCLNENINHSLFIKWDKQKWVLTFVAKWHFQILLIRTYMDTFMTFSMAVSDVKISWNAKSRRHFHFKLRQGDEETRVIFLCQEKLEKIKQKERNRLPAHVTNVGIPMVKNIEWTSYLEYHSENTPWMFSEWLTPFSNFSGVVWTGHECLQLQGSHSKLVLT